jgi:HlyD family secretion protein
METRVKSAAHARQTRQQFASSEDYLSYELGKAVRELPPLYTRLLAGTMTAIVFGAITWAHFSLVDEVATTQGELIPAQQVRPVRALEGGVIQDIKVKEGDRVKKDQVLIEQDAAVSEAETKRLRDSAALIQQDIARLQAESRGEATTGNAEQDRLIAARLRDFDTRQAAALAEAGRQEAAIAEAEANLTRLQTNLASAQESLTNAIERERTFEQAFNDSVVPRLDYLEAKNQRTQAEGQVASLEREIAAQRQQIRQTEESFQGAQESANSLGSQRQSEILTQLNQRQEELTNVLGQLERAEKQQQQGKILAPVDGTIYNVQATLGEGTVEAGEELLSILPDGGTLMLQVKVLNRDIGFIQVGDRAKVKLATFPFQEFGTIDGKVMQISPNATVDEQLGLVFNAKIELSRTAVRANGRTVDLTPGMAATAEIVTRQRSVLTFLMEPITRRFDEAFNVR